MGSVAAHQLLHNLIFNPLRLSTAVPTAAFSILRHRTKPTLSLLHLARPLSTSLPLHCSLSENSHEIDEIEVKINNNNENNKGILVEKREVPELSVKEKKELGSYANSLGEKLKSQQIGKSGANEKVFFALNETLEANELLKLKIHRSCPGELEDVVRQLEQGTGSVVVGQIGRTVILYRPSLTKLKAEEKKEQNRKLFAQKRQKFQAAAASMKREQTPRRPGQDRYQSRRFEKAPL